RRLGLWFVVNVPPNADLAASIKSYAEGASQLVARFGDFASDFQRAQTQGAVQHWLEQGAPNDLAQTFATLPFLSEVPEIILLGESAKADVIASADAYGAMGAELALDRLRTDAAKIAIDDYWDRLALRRILDDLYAGQRVLAGRALAKNGVADGK